MIKESYKCRICTAWNNLLIMEGVETLSVKQDSIPRFFYIQL